jgi:hypothetical protein
MLTGAIWGRTAESVIATDTNSDATAMNLNTTLGNTKQEINLL